MGLDIYLETEVDTGGDEPHVVDLYSANITYNVNPMWREAGVFEALMESDGKTAEEVLPALRRGVADMAAHPAKYKAMDSPNGWGTYADALPWLNELVAAFEKHPKGRIRTWQ